MKTKLIKTQDKFILVSDEKGKEGKNFNFALNKIDVLSRNYEEHSSEWNFCRKIISENPDFSLLSEEDCKTIGWVNFNKKDDIIGHPFYSEDWIKGFNTAQSLNDKMFSLEDMKKAFIAGGNSQIEEDDDYGTEYEAYMDKWFEQFKKK